MSETSRYKKTHIGDHKLHPETQMMSYGYDPSMSEGAVKPPVFLASTFVFKSAEDGADFFDVVSGRKAPPPGQAGGLVYSRFNHPNLEIVEDRLALLENGEACNVFSSGMAAISAVFLAFLRPGDVIVQSAALYGGTETMIRKILIEFGIESVEFENGLDPDSIKQALEKASTKGRVAMLYIETPANPTNAIVDFSAVVQAVDQCAQRTGHRPITVCDNTLMGPVFQRPLEHGIDLAVYSLTKYVGGHSDLVAGSVVGNSVLMSKVRAIRSAFGNHLDPHSSWMISRSLETLSLRMNRASETAKLIAQWLQNNPYTSLKVFHPDTIEDQRYQSVYRAQCTGAGATFSFVVPGGRQTAFKIINNLSLFKSAVSLGGTESLVCHPASTTHSGVALNVREKTGLTEGLIRISIGIEHPEDLIFDLDQAFKAAFQGV